MPSPRSGRKYMVNLNSFIVHTNPPKNPRLCLVDASQHGVKTVNDDYLRAFKPEYLKWCFFCFNKIAPEEFRV